MTLSALLIILNTTTPFFCSISSGYKYGGWIGALIGLAVGLTVSVGNFFGVRAVLRSCLRWVIRRQEQTPYAVWPNRIIRMLAFALGLWIVVSALLAMFLTELAIRLCQVAQK